MNNLLNFEGKHILVIGASSGIGRQTCISLSELGAKVSLVARREDKLVETVEMMEKGSHFCYSLDVTNIDEIEPIVKKIVNNNGKIDGYVHCAGIDEVRPVQQSKYDFMLNMMKISFFSFVEFVRVVQKGKYSNNGCSIVAISSAGIIRADKGKLGYCSAKGAIEGAIRPMAIELGELRQFRVNGIRPAWVRTDMFYNYENTFGNERMNEMVNNHILGISEPTDVANLIVFLLSSMSSKITGELITIDGGSTIH